MRTLSTLMFIGLAALLLNCNSNQLVRWQSGELADYRWDEASYSVYGPYIVDTSSTYDIIFTMRHVYGYQFAEIAVELTFHSPDSSVVQKEYIMPIMKEDGGYHSDCAGDLCDFEFIVEEDFVFNQSGYWDIEIRHAMPIEYVPNVMELGMFVEKNRHKAN